MLEAPPLGGALGERHGQRLTGAQGSDLPFLRQMGDLTLARQALVMTAANLQACEDAAAFLQRVAGIESGRTVRTASTADTGAG